MEKVKLSNLQHGVVIDMFDEEFGKVLKNIADDNVKPDATREICIKIQIKPDKTRQTAARGELRRCAVSPNTSQKRVPI